MPTLPNMGIITPTLGGDSGTWDDKINAGFAVVDAHDHTSGKGVAIVTAAININADLPMGGYGLTSLGKISFSTIAAPSSGSKNLFVSSADNELYWRTNAGVNVKLTNGTSINTTLVGGIVGDYSSVGAEVAFDDANKRYTFKDQSSPSKRWARLASGPVRIFEYNTTESVYVEHAVDAALAASYTVTWPAALPAAKSRVYISAAGVVSFTPDDEVLALPGAAWQSNSSIVAYGFTFGTATVSVGSTNLMLPIPLKKGDTIKSITIALFGNAAGDADVDTYDVRKVTSAGSVSSIGSTTASNLTASTWQDVTVDVSDTTLATGEVVYVRLQLTVASGFVEVGNTRITYTPRI